MSDECGLRAQVGSLVGHTKVFSDAAVVRRGTAD